MFHIAQDSSIPLLREPLNLPHPVPEQPAHHNVPQLMHRCADIGGKQIPPAPKAPYKIARTLPFQQTHQETKDEQHTQQGKELSKSNQQNREK